jgi:hypothetical protein
MRTGRNSTFSKFLKLLTRNRVIISVVVGHGPLLLSPAGRQPLSPLESRPKRKPTDEQRDPLHKSIQAVD